MKKHGFTLVELMAAVVIMGIITAVAAPKLFNAVTKAKSSELAPAVTSYTKLQSAYLYEHKALGTWKKIGYEAPGGKKGRTENFKYSKGDITSSIKGSNIPKVLSGEGKVAWQAENRVGLGDCHIGNKWQIKVVAISENEIEYRPYIVQSSCTRLTGDWGNFQVAASMITAPADYASNNGGTSSVGGSTPSVQSSAQTSSSSEAIVVAGGSTVKSSSSVAYSSSIVQLESSSSAVSSSSETKIAFYDAEENFTDEDDGSCGTLYTSNGDRCPPSWCKLNGNVSRNHGGWNSKKHKWYECYVARQELIQEADEKGLVTCKNKNVCKVTNAGTTITIKGNKISTAAEEISEEEYESGEVSSSSVESSSSVVSSSSVESSSSMAYGTTYSGKGRDNAEAYFGEEVICADGKNDSACKSWRRASECYLKNVDNTCKVWDD